MNDKWISVGIICGECGGRGGHVAEDGFWDPCRRCAGQGGYGVNLNQGDRDGMTPVPLAIGRESFIWQARMKGFGHMSLCSSSVKRRGTVGADESTL